MISQTAGIAAMVVDAWNSHDIGQVSGIFADDYEGVSVAEALPQRGAGGMARSLSAYFDAFPDLRFTLGDTVVQDNRVAFSWTAFGTHYGRLMNIPPTGRSVFVQGISMLTLERGKIKEGLHVWDVARLLRDIGLLPEL
jgi:steroid delta-isomerase-like uncharacterized protein